MPQRVLGDVLHCAQKSDGVEVVEESEVSDAEDLALHLSLPICGDQRELVFSALTTAPESTPSGTTTAVEFNQDVPPGKRGYWMKELLRHRGQDNKGVFLDLAA